jgi:hypothetical protein
VLGNLDKILHTEKKYYTLGGFRSQEEGKLINALPIKRAGLPEEVLFSIFGLTRYVTYLATNIGVKHAEKHK